MKTLKKKKNNIKTLRKKVGGVFDLGELFKDLARQIGCVGCRDKSPRQAAAAAAAPAAAAAAERSEEAARKKEDARIKKEKKEKADEEARQAAAIAIQARAREAARIKKEKKEKADEEARQAAAEERRAAREAAAEERQAASEAAKAASEAAKAASEAAKAESEAAKAESEAAKAESEAAKALAARQAEEAVNDKSIWEKLKEIAPNISKNKKYIAVGALVLGFGSFGYKKYKDLVINQKQKEKIEEFKNEELKLFGEKLKKMRESRDFKLKMIRYFIFASIGAILLRTKIKSHKKKGGFNKKRTLKN